MHNKRLLFLVQAAMIAALYTALTLIFAPISFSSIQVRISEALTILPAFTPAAVPGLFVGCLIGNILGGAALPDIIFGSFATLAGAAGTYLLFKNHADRPSFLAPIPTIAANTIIVPFILKYAYGVALPIPIMMLTVAIGEVISSGVLGMVLYFALRKHAGVIFKNVQQH